MHILIRNLREGPSCKRGHSHWLPCASLQFLFLARSTITPRCIARSREWTTILEKLQGLSNFAGLSRRLSAFFRLGYLTTKIIAHLLYHPQGGNHGEGLPTLLQLPIIVDEKPTVNILRWTIEKPMTTCERFCHVVYGSESVITCSNFYFPHRNGGIVFLSRGPLRCTSPTFLC